MLHIFALKDFPEIVIGDDLAAIIKRTTAANALTLENNDILVVAQKIVSKCEGRVIDLADIEPSAEATRLSAQTSKDPRFVECVLQESTSILRAVPGRLIVRHLSGHVMANAGIDRSNLPGADSKELVLLLPENPDLSAHKLRSALKRELGLELAVIVSDSFGRPWRRGTVNVAIGAAGIECLRDLRGTVDRQHRPLETSEVAIADAAAAAAGLAMGESDEGNPVVCIRGLHLGSNPATAQSLLRPLEEDLFQ